MGKGKDAETIEKQAEKMGIPPPDWVINKPELNLGLDFYYIAFHDLTSCRAIGMAEGPIPWTAMKTYADTYDIHGLELERFIYILTHMDIAYMKERNKKQG